MAHCKLILDPILREPIWQVEVSIEGCGPFTLESFMVLFVKMSLSNKNNERSDFEGYVIVHFLTMQKYLLII